MGYNHSLGVDHMCAVQGGLSNRPVVGICLLRGIHAVYHPHFRVQLGLRPGPAASHQRQYMTRLVNLSSQASLRALCMSCIHHFRRLAHRVVALTNVPSSWQDRPC